MRKRVPIAKVRRVAGKVPWPHVRKQPSYEVPATLVDPEPVKVLVFGAKR
jgi:hypothetical protein